MSSKSGYHELKEVINDTIDEGKPKVVLKLEYRKQRKIFLLFYSLFKLW